MRNVIVFGASESSGLLYKKIESDGCIIKCLTDNNSCKWDSYICGIHVVPPKDISRFEYDEIIILSISGMKSIKRQLIQMNIDDDKINLDYVVKKVRARESFVRGFSKVVKQYNIGGNVAEGGVFQGEFAAVINESFPGRKLYLFDTFSGFDSGDVEYEVQNNLSNAIEGHLNNTSVELVMDKMRYPENVVVIEGYFPETTKKVDDKFCFVNLDFDLYKPTKAGLKFFWDRMQRGGIIIVHDYLSQGYEGINKAVDEFSRDNGIVPFPIGDDISIAIQKV